LLWPGRGRNLPQMLYRKLSFASIKINFPVMRLKKIEKSSFCTITIAFRIILPGYLHLRKPINFAALIHKIPDTMITIKTFVFNSFSVNGFVLYDETHECVIIDPGCHSDEEKEELATFIDTHKLKPVALINTHFHVDHILGNHFVCARYHLKPTGHAGGNMFWKTANEFGSVFGLTIDAVEKTEIFVEDGDLITFGNSKLEVRYTPGHADGSICLVNHQQKFVIAGDVLFYNSIGRTDLPTGNFDILMGSIGNKLFTLDDDFIVYPGHGPSTTIGYEKRSNPFIQ